ncbi:hypothetical protein O181_105229 [Austropuccinia psidii MF-1]|uniref:Uncharacterized protein n=1 Tax=Austropuccinia psidii MF-1 TaxID=1389203 RepID=A0A9Q3JNZ8_9BASI|nr:hypothetical protein [Austropuccinia psidii MF-1]
MEICTCDDCSQYTVTLSDGGTRKGLLVHCSTRNRHRRRLANQPVEVTLSRLFPNLSFNEEEKGFQVPQLNKPKEVKEVVMNSEEDESDSGSAVQAPRLSVLQNQMPCQKVGIYPIQSRDSSSVTSIWLWSQKVSQE